MDLAIDARSLSKDLGSRRVVSNVSLVVAPGEFYGFLGPNGAGKTTTIRMLSGILAPDDGQVFIAGHSADERAAVSRVIGVMPESRGFYEWMTAEEYLDFFARLYGLTEAARKARIDTLLSRVGLTGRRRSTIGTFSRGMKQRLALARALIQEPAILFLDEPTLGLDPQGQEDILRLLQELNAQGVTIFYSSHLLNEVSRLCSRICILNEGRIVAEGVIEELRARSPGHPESLTDIFLSLTRGL